MRRIQDVGLEIFQRTPKKFYVFCGSEYGIKLKYIESLREYYDGHCESYESVKDVLDLMKVKRILPLVPSLYVVRYDESFLASLNDTTASKIDDTNIIGTIVCLYDSAKASQKLDKYLGDYTVSIDTVSPQFIKKYIHTDFAGVSDKVVDIAVACGSNYYKSKLICAALRCIDPSEVLGQSVNSIYRLFGHNQKYKESALKAGIADKNFSYCMKVLDSYDEYDSVYYTILQTLVEIDKCLSSKYSQSDLKRYVKKWAPSDIYNMFDITYSELKKSRSMSVDINSSIVFLLSLLAFKYIPRKEQVNES